MVLLVSPVVHGSVVVEQANERDESRSDLAQLQQDGGSGHVVVGTYAVKRHDVCGKIMLDFKSQCGLL